MTEIPEQTIKTLTEDYALRGPAVLGFGWGGTDKWGNSDVVGHAGVILGALTGNIGRIGGGVGVETGHFASWGADLGEWGMPEKFEIPEREMTTGDFPRKANSVKILINVGNPMQQHFASFEDTCNWVKKLDFVVAIDPFHNSVWILRILCFLPVPALNRSMKLSICKFPETMFCYSFTAS